MLLYVFYMLLNLCSEKFVFFKNPYFVYTVFISWIPGVEEKKYEEVLLGSFNFEAYYS